MFSKQIKASLDFAITDNTVVKQRIQQKREYLMTRPDDLEDIPSELNVKRWTTFLPPLKRVELEASSKKAVAAEFKDSLIDAVSTGNASQVEKINTLMSKLFYYSLAIQQSIQGTVDKEETVLKTNNGMPFMENVCCNDGTVDTFNYFNEKSDGELAKYNKMAEDIKKIYSDYMAMVKPVYYTSKQDTKIQYPSPKPEFTDDTIYGAFIHFCKFNKNVPLGEDLMSICLSNKSSFRPGDSLATKIDTLKKEGRMFTIDNLHSLLNIINKHNLVKVELKRDALSQKDKLQAILEGDILSTLPHSSLALVLRDLIDNFDGIMRKEADEKITDALYNLLKTQTTAMKTQITAFIRKPAADKFIKEFTNWREISNPITVNSEDETNSHVVDQIRQYMTRICCELPRLVMNKVTYENTAVPSHWDLSDKHNSEISAMINEFVSKLKVNYVDAGDLDEGEIDTDDNLANKQFEEILRSIGEKTKEIYLLMKNTPFYAAINDTTKPIVGSKLIVMLHEYYLLSVFTEYINTSAERNNKLLSEKIAKLLMTFIDILSASKSMINMNKDDIMAQVLRSKEIEKKEITDYLGAMSDERRKVEDLFKASKLGDKWSIGLTSAVYKYDPDVYDKEMESAAKRAAADSRTDGEGVSEVMGQDVMDEYDMTNMANDDEYAEGMDGDEAY
jgi:hypothetical protein